MRKMKNHHVGGIQLPLLTPDTAWSPPPFTELEGPQAWDTETWDPDLQEKGPGWIPGGEGYIAGFSVSADNFTGYFPIRHDGFGNLDPDQVIRYVKDQIKKPVPKIFANAPYDIGWMAKEEIRVRPEEIHDIQLQAPLLNEYRKSYSLDNLAKTYLDSGKETLLLREALASYGFSNMGYIAKLPAPYVGPYAEGDAEKTRDLWKLFNGFIDKEELNKVYDLERALVPLTIAMRMRGVPVNVDRAEQLRADMKREQGELLNEVKRRTLVQVDPWIGQTIAAALESEGIKCPMTPKTHQPSITAEWLEELKNPIADMILKVRKIEKAVGTFIDGHVLGYQRNGRVHAQFSQLRHDNDDTTSEYTAMKGTVGGRYSSDSPNLQQIPIRDPEIGWRIRDLFEGEEGEDWASADYSSQEPRLTVHFAAKANMPGSWDVVERYHQNPRLDFHGMVAEICGIPRDQAKPINLGLAYGMGGAKLCRQLGLPTAWKEIVDRETGQTIQIEIAGPEGQDILDKVNANAPFIGKLAKMCINVANDRGYIKTIFGRRCRFELYQGKRQWTHKALNRLIQGSAADQTKEAMRQLYYDHNVIPLATVHDELCFSVPDEVTAKRYARVMENAIPLEIPVICDIKYGRSWGTVKKLAA